MAWGKDRIQLDNGVFADAQAPEIVSASRSTDILAFYADWFFTRLKKGYSAWTNPFNGVKSGIISTNPGDRVYIEKGWLFPVILLWELRESNPRPSACKADALNQLS